MASLAVDLRHAAPGRRARRTAPTLPRRSAPPARDPAAPQPGRRRLGLPRRRPLGAAAAAPWPSATRSSPCTSPTRASSSCPPSGSSPWSTPRPGRQRYVQTASPALRASATRRPRPQRHAEHRARASRRAGAEYLHLSTDRDWLTDTVLFATRRMRLRPRPRPPVADTVIAPLHARAVNHDDLPVRAGGCCCWCCPLALLVAYVLVQRRRHTQVLRFTSVDLLDSVAPARSGWQRHVPAAALLLVRSSCSPSRSPSRRWRCAPRKDRATILLTLDTSASMTATDVAPSRLGPPRPRPRSSSRTCPRASRSGWSPSTAPPGCSCRRPPTPAPGHSTPSARSTVGGGTATAAGIRDVARRDRRPCPRAPPASRRRRSIVLMSDGSPTIGDGDLVADGRRRRRRAARRRAQSVADRHDRVRHLRRHGRPSRARRSRCPYDPRGHGRHRAGERRADVHRRDAPTSSARSTTRSAATSPTSCRPGS